MSVKLVTLGSTTVTTAGARVQISASALPISTIIFQAASGNTNGIVIGDVTVAASTGIRLLAGQVLTITGDQRSGYADELILSDFYADTDTNSNKVIVAYVKQRN